VTDSLDDDERAIRDRLVAAVGLLTSTQPPLSQLERRIGRRRRQRLVVAGASICGAAAAVVAIILVVAQLDGGRSNRGVEPGRTPSPTPSGQGPSASASTGPPGSAMLKSFSATSVSFVDAAHGWALGDGECADAASRRCMAIARTSDGGQTWVAIPAPDGLTTDYRTCGNNGVVLQGPCVNNVRFVDALHGYVYSNRAMFMTADGGATWQQQPGVTATDGAYAVVPTGSGVARLPELGDCDGACRSAVEVSSLGSSTWRDVTPKAARDAQLRSMNLLTSGHAVVLFGYEATSGAPALFTSSDDGNSWTTRSSALTVCSADARLYISSIAPDGAIAGSCDSSAAGGAALFMIRSTDGGATFTRAGLLPTSTLSTSPSLVSANASTFFAEFTNGLQDVLHGSFDGGQSWQTIQELNAPGSAPALAGQPPSFTTVNVGFRLTDPTTLWTTADGGRTWAQRPIR
jgi:photosystem II stability/assembly factor-like uncharacterized protein